MADRQRRYQDPSAEGLLYAGHPLRNRTKTYKDYEERARQEDLRRIAFETARGSPETQSYLGLGRSDIRKRRKQLRPEPDFMDGVLQAILRSLGDDRGFGLSGTFLGGGV